MAPYAGFDVEKIKDKARKDLLYLLEGVSDPNRCFTLLDSLVHRFVERKILSLKRAWLDHLAYSSTSLLYRIMVPTRYFS